MKATEKVQKRNEVLSAMINSLYEIEVTIQAKGKKKKDYTGKADLEKIYEALSLLPLDHIKTSSLKLLEIKPVDNNRAEYSIKNQAMIVDTIKIRNEKKYSFEIGGKTHTVATLSMATLHEVGHAVDHKTKIMSGDAITDQSYGGWIIFRHKGFEELAEAYLKTLKLDEQDAKNAMLLLSSAAAGQVTSRAERTDISEKLYKAVLPAMKELVAWKNTAKPWEKPRALDGVVYHFTYSSWYAYKEDTRGLTKVSDYQWRSPIEWFAELYAATWLAKLAPPPGVNAKVAEYLYQG